ncbi:hypothetical protein [Ramlibacter sp.]|uniref:hypothetical protein n=1 Tax=Ramlibacter sp. TaxID=1917967 RepID=UPI003D147F68
MNVMQHRRFELCFQSLFEAGRGYAFPCDERGVVDLDGLSEKARASYLYARAMVGRDLAVPAVRVSVYGDAAGVTPSTDR